MTKKQKEKAERLINLLIAFFLGLALGLMAACAPIEDAADVDVFEPPTEEVAQDKRPVDLVGCLPDVVPAHEGQEPTACEYGSDWMLCKYGSIWEINVLTFHTDPSKSCQWTLTEVVQDFDQVDPETWGLYSDLTREQTNERQVWSAP